MIVFTVTVAASSLALLTAAELRTAIGLAANDASQDAALSAVGLQVTAQIMAECHVASDGIHPPTLLSETVQETIWITRRASTVGLSRRFVSAISSITEDGIALVSTDYDLDREAGTLRRMRDGWPGSWGCVKLAVTYVAGFTTVPDDLKAAAISFVHSSWLEAQRDPFVKSTSVDVPGVMNRKQDFWVGGIPQNGPSSVVPATITDQLARYRNVTVY